MPDQSRANLQSVGRVVYGLATLLWASACSPSPCDPAGEGIQAGDRVKVRVVEHYDENSAFVWDPGILVHHVRPYGSCGERFDFFDGAEVTFRISGERQAGSGCLLRDASLEGRVPGFDAIGPANIGFSGTATPPLFEGGNSVKSADGCEGGWYVAVVSRGNSAFSRPVVGRLPPALLYREFRTANPDACRKPGGQFTFNKCFDYFVVELTKV